MSRAMLVMVAAIIAGSLLAGPAGARVVIDKVTGQKFGIVPVPEPPHASLGAQRAPGSTAAGKPTCDSQAGDSNCASPMTSHGGLVQHAENDILFFWDPNGFASEPGYVSDMQTWLSSLASGDYSPGAVAGSEVGNPISVVQQYYDNSGPGGTKNFIPYAVRNAGTVMDTDAFPSSNCTDSYVDRATTGQPTVTLPMCFTSAQLFAELNQYIKAHNLPRGINTEYFILTPPNVGSCDDSTSKSCAISAYCGWHTFAGFPSNPSGQTVYADLPWLEGNNCDVNRLLTAAGTTSPNLYSSGIDPMVSVFSHELAETMTDPNVNGWFGTGGGTDEVGDKCVVQYTVGNDIYDFTGLPIAANGATYNTVLNGHDYLLQMEYDNRAGGCNQWDTDAQPTAALSTPANAASRAPASFTLTNVSAPAGTAYVTWYFGDATSGRSTGATPILHTYAAGGTYTVTAILTDNDGNEVKESAPVTVSKTTTSLSVTLSNIHPAPKAAYTVKLKGLAAAGGVLGSGHNRSEVDLYEQGAGACATSRALEASRAAGGTATAVGQWFEAPGAFALSQQRLAVRAQNATTRFCAYLSRSTSLTDATATAAYTTT